jgi:pyruvate dehydrogenase (quinone)
VRKFYFIYSINEACNLKQYTGLRTADIIVDALLDWDIDTIFGLPGDGINGVIESLRTKQDKIKFKLVRHEESAAFMACAYAKYTGKLGVCIATSGPGAVHLAQGLYDAKLDNTPVLAITGSTYSDMIGSKYLQDVNLVQLFSDVSVYNNMIIQPEQAEMSVDMACRTAIANRGVSHLTIPIDVQERRLKGQYSPHKVSGHTSDTIVTIAMPDLKLLKKAADILNSGRKVVILVGQGALNAGDEVSALSNRLGAPVVKALLGKAVIPDDYPNSLGGLGMLGTDPATDAMNEADTLLMVGTSFPFIEFLPKPGQARGVQIDINAGRIGLRYPVEIGLIGDSKLILSALLPLIHQKNDTLFLREKQRAMKEWRGLLKDLMKNQGKQRMIKPQAVAAAVSDELKDNAIISLDSGTNTIWAARYINLRKGMKLSVSGTLASVGCGLPYAVAAQIAFPDRQSVAFVGDGGMTMLMGEFATAVQYKLPIKVVVLKNNAFGMVRWEQMVFLGNPEFGVEFTPIDFAKFAEACGGRGYSVTEHEKLQPVMHRAMLEKRPTIIDVTVDPLEPPMPPKVELEFVSKLAESFAKGQPHAVRIGLTVFRHQVREALRNLDSGSAIDD